MRGKRKTIEKLFNKRGKLRFEMEKIMMEKKFFACEKLFSLLRLFANSSRAILHCCTYRYMPVVYSYTPTYGDFSYKLFPHTHLYFSIRFKQFLPHVGSKSCIESKHGTKYECIAQALLCVCAKVLCIVVA